MADKKAQEEAAANQDVQHNYGSVKATIRRTTRGGEIFHERICLIYGMKGEKLDRREESKLSRKEMTMGRLKSGHHPELKYWLHKIWRAVDTICRRCGIGEETAEHVMYDCPRIHHPTLAEDPQMIMRILEKWTTVQNLHDVSQPGITTT